MQIGGNAALGVMTPPGGAIVCDDTALAFKTCNLHGVDIAEFQAYSITKPVLGNRGRSEFFQRACIA